MQKEKMVPANENALYLLLKPNKITSFIPLQIPDKKCVLEEIHKALEKFYCNNL